MAEKFYSSLKVVNSIARPLVIYCDNSTAFYSKNNQNTGGFNHIEIKYLKICELVKQDDVVVEHIGTKLYLRTH